jgi:L-cysteine:1D-myo-inositol 2-amino-2-deoxy-alpha-D-glucopyranoside ligase
VLKTAQQRLSRWREAVAGSGPAFPVERLRERLADDLDTPGALAVVDEWAEGALSGDVSDPAAGALGRTAVDALLGVRL